MAVKIRLRAQGRVNRKSYRLVVADCHGPRDGKYIEALGWYDPKAAEEQQLYVKPDRLEFWLAQGAQCSETVTLLMRKAAPAVMTKLMQKELAKRAKETKQQRQRGKQA